MTDDELISLITKNNKLKYISKNYLNKLKRNNIELYNEIINRYDDYDSINEILYRLKNNIEIRPVCKYCKGRIKFINIHGNRHWQEYCSQECLHNDKDHWNKCKQTKLERYGDENYVNSQKAKQTKLEKYGDENYNNIQLSKKTRLEKYGQWHSINAIKKFKHKSKEAIQNQIKKSKQTKLEKYGNENYNNLEKQKATCLKKYGVEYTGQLPEKIQKTKITNNIKYGGNAPICSKEIKEKIQKTIKNKYNVDFISQNSQIKEKIKKTVKDKYGVDYILQLNSIREKNTCSSIKSRQKAKETILKKFGQENYNNRIKAQLTCLNKYGVSNKRKLKESREYMSKIMSSTEVQNKRNNTLKINKSFNISKPENESYNLLKEKYSDIIRQYRSDSYPYACDFYIPSLDLYIECNYHWTHGGKIYEGTKEDNIKLEKWKSKNTKYYKNAINTWTNLDIRKYNTAKENKLNYFLFYNINELKNWLLKNEI